MKYDICVVGGAGHVGLPLAIAFAEKNQQVIIYDINQNALSLINEGKMPFMEEGSDIVLPNVIHKTLFTTDNIDSISQAKFVIVVIGTPVDEHLNPTFHDMKRFFDSISPHLRTDQVIILRSTVYPGITEKIYLILEKEHPGIGVAFCPERILEGKAMEELCKLPQIISGFNPKTIQEVKNLFSLLTKDVLIISPLEAELAKLFTNSWRYIQFAAANQFYTIAEEYGADFYKIFDAMTYNYPRLKSFPKAGFAAGPCLFKDTMQISAFTNNKFFLGHSAMLVNEGLPTFVVEQLKRKYPLQNMTVGILGMAFKAESDDKRESLSYKLRKILEVEAKSVMCSDVYIHDEGFINEDELIQRCDIIIIGAPHKKYKELNFKNKILYDVWNMQGKKGLEMIQKINH